MTTQQLINNLEVLKRVISTPKIKQRICTVGIVETFGKMSVRIFEEGKDANGNKIGTYSTKKTYIGNRLGVPKFSTKKFKNGNRRKTRTFEGGYKEYRAKVGRQNSFVDLHLTGSMQAAFDFGSRADGSCVIGFTSETEAAKMEGNEARYKKLIAAPTESEKKCGIDAARAEVISIITDIL